MNRETIRHLLNDPNALAATLDGECAGEPIEGQIGVACAIRNRVNADIGHDGKPDWWGEGYAGVCLAPKQFSCWWGANGNTDRVYQTAQALIDRQPVGPAITELRWIAEGIIGGAIRDHVNGANHYLTTRLFQGPGRPLWAKPGLVVAIVGSQTFFRL